MKLNPEEFLEKEKREGETKMLIHSKLKLVKATGIGSQLERALSINARIQQVEISSLTIQGTPEDKDHG